MLELFTALLVGLVLFLGAKLYGQKPSEQSRQEKGIDTDSAVLEAKKQPSQEFAQQEPKRKPERKPETKMAARYADTNAEKAAAQYTEVANLAELIATRLREGASLVSVTKQQLRLSELISQISVTETPAVEETKVEKVESASTSSFEVVASQSEATVTEDVPQASEPGPEDGVVIIIKPRGQPSFKVRCRTEGTLLELKQTIALETKVAVEAVKLLLKGKVLKDNRKKCSGYKIAEGVKITLLPDKKGMSRMPYEPEKPQPSTKSTKPKPKKAPPAQDASELDDMLDDVLSTEVVVAPVAAPASISVPTRPAAARQPLGGSPFAGIMNNPMMKSMAQNMMKNPQMMQNAQNMMGARGSQIGGVRGTQSGDDAWKQGLSLQEASMIDRVCSQDHRRIQQQRLRPLSAAYVEGSPGLVQSRR